MSVYYGEFRFANRSNLDFGLRVVSFSGGQYDQDSFLSMESVYTNNYDGTQRFDYGARYNSVATFDIEMAKEDGTIFSLQEIRYISRWLTGARTAQSIDFLGAGQEVIMTFYGRFTNFILKKMDARVIGVVATFEAISPWAFSVEQSTTQAVSGSASIVLYNDTDDVYSYIYPSVVFLNDNDAGSLFIQHMELDEITEVQNIVANEEITILPQHIILSDKTGRIFGDDFNFVWPRFKPGNNTLVISGAGSITIKYRTPIKAADAIADLENTTQCI